MDLQLIIGLIILVVLYTSLDKKIKKYNYLIMGCILIFFVYFCNLLNKEGLNNLGLPINYNIKGSQEKYTIPKKYCTNGIKRLSPRLSEVLSNQYLGDIIKKNTIPNTETVDDVKFDEGEVPRYATSDSEYKGDAGWRGGIIKLPLDVKDGGFSVPMNICPKGSKEIKDPTTNDPSPYCSDMVGICVGQGGDDDWINNKHTEFQTREECQAKCNEIEKCTGYSYSKNKICEIYGPGINQNIEAPWGAHPTSINNVRGANGNNDYICSARYGRLAVVSNTDTSVIASNIRKQEEAGEYCSDKINNCLGSGAKEED